MHPQYDDLNIFDKKPKKLKDTLWIITKGRLGGPKLYLVVKVKKREVTLSPMFSDCMKPFMFTTDRACLLKPVDNNCTYFGRAASWRWLRGGATMVNRSGSPHRAATWEISHIANLTPQFVEVERTGQENVKLTWKEVLTYRPTVGQETSLTSRIEACRKLRVDTNQENRKRIRGLEAELESLKTELEGLKNAPEPPEAAAVEEVEPPPSVYDHLNDEEDLD